MDIGTQPQDAMEFVKDEVGWSFYDALEWCIAGCFIFELRNSAVMWALLIPLVIVSAHLCMKPTSVIVDFQKKLAVYKYPRYLFFKKEKQVSLSDFTLVYLSGHRSYNNWSIHLSNRKGAHLEVIGVTSIKKAFPNFEKAREMTDQLAKGLGIQSAHFQ